MHKIAVIGGDGTGPEVVAEGLKALDIITQQYNIDCQFIPMDINGERYKRTGEILTDQDMTELKACDAIYLGAIGHPEVQPGILERGILLKLRFDLDQYINYRPVKLYQNVESPIKNASPETIDYVVIRENTGGLYTGVGSIENKGTAQEVASQSMIYSRHQVERCIRFAFETVKKRHHASPWKGLTQDQLDDGKVGKVTLCGKTNVLTYVFDLWERVFHDVAKDYPEIIINYTHVDAVCVHMIERPETFDVIVTSNMFGDIITDLAAVTQGGMGVAASGNINPNGVSMFEPIGGTAPDFTGKDQINPMAAIGAAHLMLDHLGYSEAANKLELAKISVIKKGKSMLAGKMGFKTSEIGNMISDELYHMARN
ncbi:MAG: 3-isopropylmalate dehydrogenase [Candidatus Margulisiibacteriota bacterium]